MRIENTYDEILFAAHHAGLEPDESDFAQVRVPGGVDAAEFRAETAALTRRIVDLRRQGKHGEARSLATEAQQSYLDQFVSTGHIPAGTTNTAQLDDLGFRIFQR